MLGPTPPCRARAPLPLAAPARLCDDRRVTPRPSALLLLPALILAAPPAHARDALGIFSSWAAFRDPATPLCYAIAMPTALKSAPPPDYQPYAAIGTWPRRGVHGALHLRLSHRLAPGSPITLSLGGGSGGGRRFHLVGGGGDAWPADPRDDAAIAATLRSSSTLTVSARSPTGHPFTDTYPLAGAPTAIDAAAIGCAGLK